MDIDTADLGDVILLRPGDDLDLLGYQAVSEKLDKVLHGGHRKIVIDLCRTTYVNSSAAGALVRFHERARRSGGVVALACVRGGAAAMLAASGTLKMLASYESVEEAIAALRGGQAPG